MAVGVCVTCSHLGGYWFQSQNIYNLSLCMCIEIVLTFNPNRSLVFAHILCVVEHIDCLILEDIADYAERIRQTRCRQTNEK